MFSGKRQIAGIPIQSWWFCPTDWGPAELSLKNIQYRTSATQGLHLFVSTVFKYNYNWE